MAFQYAVIARGTVPLAEYSIVKGNIRTLATRMLENLDPAREIAVLEQDKFVFQSLTSSDNLTFLCFTEKSVSGDQRNAFLTELQQRWRLKYGNSSAAMKAYAKTEEFKPDFISLFNTYNNEGTITVQTIEPDHMININENQRFEMEVNGIRRENCMDWMKWVIIVGILLVVALVIVVYVICDGFDLGKCFGFPDIPVPTETASPSIEPTD